MVAVTELAGKAALVTGGADRDRCGDRAGVCRGRGGHDGDRAAPGPAGEVAGQITADGGSALAVPADRCGSPAADALILAGTVRKLRIVV